ncbi:MAG: phosphate ABC transporter permease PstA [Treponema sp.]|nr:phosphate ABC transporter permease PstA [Treponema sp.]
MKQTSQSYLIRTIVYTCAGITAAVIGGLVAYILYKGLPNFSLSLFAFHYSSENASLFPALVNTLTVTFISLLLAVPVGVGSAVYLAEYARRGNRFVRVIRITAETLSGIPSIVYGLFGYLLYVTALKWQFSLLAGCCTLAVMILPVIMRTTEEALLAVPDTYREASFGLGAGKLRTVFKIVLPAAVPGIVNGIVLSTGRIVGETAALLYTAGTVAHIPVTLMGSGRTLAVHLYSLWCEGLKTEQAYATAVVLLVFVLLLNWISGRLEKIASRGKKNG